MMSMHFPIVRASTPLAFADDDAFVASLSLPQRRYLVAHLRAHQAKLQQAVRTAASGFSVLNQLNEEGVSAILRAEAVRDSGTASTPASMQRPTAGGRRHGRV